MVFKNYYKILDLETSRVSIDEIRQAYRQAAKKYHPDLNIGDNLAEERIKDINEAYKTLSVPFLGTDLTTVPLGIVVVPTGLGALSTKTCFTLAGVVGLGLYPKILHQFNALFLCSQVESIASLAWLSK